jgi:AraC-like DNA-binding protein
MNKIILPFEEINPFIRYSHIFSIEPDHYLSVVKAYDYRLMYVHDGKGYFLIDGIKYEVLKGHLLLWSPGIKYSIHPDSQKPFSIIGINFDFTSSKREINYPIPPDKEDIFDKNKITETIEFNNFEAFNKLIHLKNMQFIESKLLELTNEYMTRKKYYDNKIRGYFLSIIGDIARCISTTNMGSESMNNKVDLIIEYIHENYNNSITNEEIGAHFNFHSVYINRLMVRYTGSSLHQYLINYRISIAINLLQTTNKSITEIAYSVGFKDINYFSKYFKKLVGVSPKNYVANSRGSF